MKHSDINIMITKREHLWFGDMSVRTFLNEDEHIGIVILQPKGSKTHGYIEWTITKHGSHIRLFATPNDSTESDDKVPVSYNCNFSIVQSDRMIYDSDRTWSECEVSKCYFIGNDLILDYVKNKSLAFMFNALMAKMFSKMYYNRPKTNPGVSFKPLTQQNLKYIISKDDSTIWFPLRNNCAGIWNPTHESMREILFIPDRLNCYSLNVGNSSNTLTKLYRHNAEISKRKFIDTMMEQSLLLEDCNTQRTAMQKISELYQIQADLWYNLVTTIKKYRK